MCQARLSGLSCTISRWRCQRKWFFVPVCLCTKEEICFDSRRGRSACMYDIPSFVRSFVPDLRLVAALYTYHEISSLSEHVAVNSCHRRSLYLAIRSTQPFLDAPPLSMRIPHKSPSSSPLEPGQCLSVYPVWCRLRVVTLADNLDFSFGRIGETLTRREDRREDIREKGEERRGEEKEKTWDKILCVTCLLLCWYDIYPKFGYKRQCSR